MSKVNIKLQDDRILVKHQKQAEASDGGILLPATSKPPYNKSDVIAVGPGPIIPTTSSRRTLTVKAGDVVAHYGDGTKFTLDGEDYNILRENDIIAIL